jgi:hypothetical protein
MTEHKPMEGLADWLRQKASQQSWWTGNAMLLRWADEVEAAQYGDCSYWCPACFAEIDKPEHKVEAASRPQGDVVEAVAKAIYEQWVAAPGYVAWVDGGNSINQDEARRIASEALAGRLAAPQAQIAAFIERQEPLGPELQRVLDENRRALYSRDDAAPASIPEGYVLVPKEPTEDMRVAGVDAYNAHNSAMFFYVWKAMIAAAPQPQPAGVPQQARVGDDRRSKVIRFALFRFAHDAHSMANEAAQDISGLRYKPGAAEAFMRDAEDAQAILADMRSASPIAPASQPAEAPRMLTPGELIDAGVLVSSGAMADVALRVQFKFMSVNAGRTIPAAPSPETKEPK